MTQKQEGKQKVRLAEKKVLNTWEVLWIGYYRSNRDLVPILPVESECMTQGGMEQVCRVVIGCAQPDGWKITSANPNVERFCSRGGSIESH